MSYWGNEYMPMVDALAEGAAAVFVAEHGKAIGHAWPACDGSSGTDGQALAYLGVVLGEAREEFAGCGGDMSYDGGYARLMFEALAFGTGTLMEGDWMPSSEIAAA